MATSELGSARLLVDVAQAVSMAALRHAAQLTEGGAKIDDYQVHTERVAYLATQVRAAHELTATAGRLAAAGRPDAIMALEAHAYAAEVAQALRGAVEAHWDDFGVAEAAGALEGDAVRAAIRAGLAEARLREIGRARIAAGGANNVDLEDEVAVLTRQTAREFARNEVAPRAQEIHRQDLLVPEDLIQKFAAQGFFGSSIPEAYGGTGMGDLAMIIITEELSVASLAAAGSLATRPEILSRALLAAGTEEQKQHWLPRLARGETIVAVAVTEPDIGSDNASVQTRAELADHDGRRGWRINGAKAWSTFSGRADVLSMLVRTDPDVSKGARGLSLFIVPKAPYPGHAWRHEQPEGGVLTGTANSTPGYRGMHSFTIAIDNYWVAHEHLVGEDAGIGQGFFVQMGGFAAARLQTGGRAIGVAQASLEKACQYVVQRSQFGLPLAEYQLTQHRIGVMSTHLAAARQLTYAAARGFDSRGMEAPMAKLLACDVAVETSQAAQQLHGGWGYSEEDPVSRYVVDALVLPIFEGVKPILELKVIGRQLLAQAAR
ncbi:MAG: acyl-CoA dehydrogenase [Chloroflexi bacterium]|nr:acyl-CoA dehydrogenase [Chloroflexota bacterium]